MHLMCDLETLGTRPGSVVLSVALVRFSDLASVSVNLSVPDQTALGLVQDESTLAWWKTQPPEAWAAATQNPLPLPLATALPYLASWIEWARGAEDALIWCHGAGFDCPILEEVYRRAGLADPWKFWNVQCTRTLFNLSGVDVRNYREGPPHVALNDAMGQTRAAVAALSVLAERRGLAA